MSALKYWVTQFNKEKRKTQASNLSENDSSPFVLISTPGTSINTATANGKAATGNTAAEAVTPVITAAITIHIGGIRLEINNHCLPTTMQNILHALQPYV